MNPGPPKTLVKSRENLQTICNNNNKYPYGVAKYETYDKILLNLWMELTPLFKQDPPPSKYAIDLLQQAHNAQMGFIFTKPTVLEFIEVLKREYPEVGFTYIETPGFNGKMLERIVIMDWS